VQKSLGETLADIGAQLSKLSQRVEALESAPAIANTDALADHPVMVRIRAFLDKWDHPAG
jgi:hypothetical protein